MKWFKRWYRESIVSPSNFDEMLQSTDPTTITTSTITTAIPATAITTTPAPIESANESIIVDNVIMVDNNNVYSRNCKKNDMIRNTTIESTFTATAPATSSSSSFVTTNAIETPTTAAFVAATNTAAVAITNISTNLASSIPNVNNNNNTDIQTPSNTPKQSKVTNPLVDKRNNSILLKNTQCESKQCHDSDSNNVNANGNGENCGSSVQKSKETRRRKIIIVRQNSGTEYEDTDQNQVENSITDSNCNVRHRTRAPLTPSQRILRKRARELEHFISDIAEKENTSENNSSDDDDDKEQENLPVTEYQSSERRFSDWVVVSIELEHETPSNEEQLANQQLTDQQLNNRIDNQYYTTSEISHTDENSTVVTLHRSHPSSINFDQHQQEDYGLFHSRNRTVRRLLSLFKFLDFDIKTGSVSVNDLDADHHHTTPTLNTHTPQNTTQICKLPSSSIQTQPSCSNTNMGGKKIEMLPSQILLTPQSSISTSSLRSMEASDRAIGLDQFYGLTDDGDIIIHMEHIQEDKGVGFITRRSKPIYKKVKVGTEMREKKYRIAFTLKCLFQQLIDTIYYGCRSK